MLGTPAVWLGGALAVGVALFAANVAIRHSAEVKGARNEGIAIGTGKTATAALEESAKAANDYRAAEAETPLDADREYFKQLCGRQASCELREKYRGKK